MSKTGRPLPLQDQCYLDVILHLEEFSVYHLALLPSSFRRRLLLNLPAADVCRLEVTPVVDGIDMEEVWKQLFQERVGDLEDWLSNYCTLHPDDFTSFVKTQCSYRDHYHSRVTSCLLDMHEWVKGVELLYTMECCLGYTCEIAKEYKPFDGTILQTHGSPYEQESNTINFVFVPLRYEQYHGRKPYYRMYGELIQNSMAIFRSPPKELSMLFMGCGPVLQKIATATMKLLLRDLQHFYCVDCRYEGFSSYCMDIILSSGSPHLESLCCDEVGEFLKYLLPTTEQNATRKYPMLKRFALCDHVASTDPDAISQLSQMIKQQTYLERLSVRLMEHEGKYFHLNADETALYLALSELVCRPCFYSFSLEFSTTHTDPLFNSASLWKVWKLVSVFLASATNHPQVLYFRELYFDTETQADFTDSEAPQISLDYIAYKSVKFECRYGLHPENPFAGWQNLLDWLMRVAGLEHVQEEDECGNIYINIFKGSQTSD